MNEDKKELRWKRKDIKKERKKLKDLGVEDTWNTFIHDMEQQAKQEPVDPLISFARHLEERLRNLYKEKQLIDTEKSRLEKELHGRRKDLDVEAPSNILPQKAINKNTEEIDVSYIRELVRRIREIFTENQKSEAERIRLEEELELRKYEFKVNDFLTLKLEDNKTFIYVKGKKFIQCIRLFLQITSQESELYEEVESIDEATEIYDKFLYNNTIVQGDQAKPTRKYNYSVAPEEEFWGHCSNIQAWVEYNYDTRLIHSNLVFQLLRELTFAGDPKAKAIFEEEIAIRFESGYFSVVAYLLEQEYLLYIDKDRLKTLLEDNLGLEDRFLENKNVLVGYGTLFIKIGNYHKAIKMLKNSLEIDPKSIRALSFIGIAYGILGDHDKASQSFREIIQILNNIGVREKFIMRVYNELALYGLALSISHLNEYKEMFNFYIPSSKSPKTPLQVHKTIFGVLKRLVKKKPLILLTLIENGYIRYIGEEELSDFSENVTGLPPPQFDDESSLINYVIVNLLIGDFSNVKYIIKNILNKKDLKNPILPQYLLGIAYGGLNQHEKAVETFKKVLETNDKDDIAWFGLGLSYARSGGYIKLIKLLNIVHPPIYFKVDENKKSLYKKWYAKTVKTLESFVPIVIGNQKYSVIEKVEKFLGKTVVTKEISKEVDFIQENNNNRKSKKNQVFLYKN